MAFYYIIWGGALMLSLPRLFKNSAHLPISLLYALMTIIAVLIACRVDVGADWSNYVELYVTDSLTRDDVNRIEPLYRLSRWFFYPLGFSYQGYFFIISMFMMYTIYWITKKFDIKNYYLAFWIYISTIFCSYQLNTIRSGLMATCVWIAFVCLCEGNKKKSIVWSLVGSGFHYVGIAFFFLLFVIDKKIKRKYIFITLGLSCAIMVTGVATKVLDAIPLLANFERLSKYIDPSIAEGGGFSLGNIMNLCVYLYCMFIYRNEYEDSAKYRVIINALLVCFVITAIFNAFSTVVSRIGQVLNMSLIFIWPLIFQKLKLSLFKIGLYIIFAVYLYLYYMKAFQINEFYGYSTNVPFQFEIANFFRI